MGIDYKDDTIANGTKNIVCRGGADEYWETLQFYVIVE